MSAKLYYNKQAYIGSTSYRHLHVTATKFNVTYAKPQ